MLCQKKGLFRSWKNRGNNDLYGSKDAVRGAFKLGIIEHGQIWMDMIKSRNNSFHTYNRETAKEVYELIVEQYFFEFEQLHTTLSGIISTVYEEE